MGSVHLDYLFSRCGLLAKTVSPLAQVALPIDSGKGTSLFHVSQMVVILLLAHLILELVMNKMLVVVSHGFC